MRKICHLSIKVNKFIDHLNNDLEYPNGIEVHIIHFEQIGGMGLIKSLILGEFILIVTSLFSSTSVIDGVFYEKKNKDIFKDYC